MRAGEMAETGDYEVVLDAKARLGEGPSWHAASERLLWVDIDRCELHHFSPRDGTDQVIQLEQPVGSAVPRGSGGYVAGLRDGVALLSPEGEIENLVEIEADLLGNRMNDGKCDSAGRFWTGTMSTRDEAGAGCLYRVDAELRVETVLDDVSISNGIGWSPADDRMYYIDTPTRGIAVFDYDPVTGSVENPRRLVEIEPDAGLPDGMSVDAEGHLWVALWRGWGLRRYAPDGSLERHIELPASRITSCAFGGPDLRQLYVTSARAGLSEVELREEPFAGALFLIDPGVAGLPTREFAG